MKLRFPVILAAAALAAPAFAQQARDSETFEQRIERLEAEIAYLKDNARANRREIAEADVALAKLPDIEKSSRAADWAGKIRVKGDFRYRHEQIDDASLTTDRLRHRVRVRLGVEAARIVDVYRAMTASSTPATNASRSPPAN